MTLPQIPGVVRTNDSIPDGKIVFRVRAWMKSSEPLSRSPLDLMHISDDKEGRTGPPSKAICGLLRTELELAGGVDRVPAVAVLFYKSLDFLNREFWEDQIRRLCDIVAEQYLGPGPGIYLMIHHGVQSWEAPAVEVGDHRLLVDTSSLLVFRSVSARDLEQVKVVTPEFKGYSDHLTRLQSCHRLSGLQIVDSSESQWGRHYVLVDSNGFAICGAQVLGSLPFRLVCGSPWCQEGQEAQLGELLGTLMCRFRRPACQLFFDRGDPQWQRISHSGVVPSFGSWRVQRQPGIMVTGMPVSMTEDQQLSLVKTPFQIPWEFVPFHAGNILVL